MPQELKSVLPGLAASFVLVSLVACASMADSVTYPPNAPRIASDFNSILGVNGKRRTSRHNGIDIIGDDGQPILAAANGKVLETTVEGCWGPTIAIDHGKDREGKNIIALYGHVGPMLVEKGDEVSRGQVIAHLGKVDHHCMFGVRHLHFQIGRDYRGEAEKGNTWGHSYFLKDGGRGVNPHFYWADGPAKVTCYEPDRSYPPGTLTYPVPCK